MPSGGSNKLSSLTQPGAGIKHRLMYYRLLLSHFLNRWIIHMDLLCLKGGFRARYL